MVDKEEGEVSEEGELPQEEGEEAAPAEAAAPPAQAAAAGPQSTAAAAAQPADKQRPEPQQQQQQQPPKPEAAAPAAQQQPQQQAPGPAAPAAAGTERGRDRDRDKDKGSKDRRGGGGGGEAGGSSRHHEAHDGSSSKHRAAEREKAELSQELDKLTADLTFVEIRSNWGTACPNIKQAIKKLDKLLRRVKRKREDDVELYPPCHEFAGRVLAALKHVTVITSTGLGKTVDMELGHNTMRAATNYRHDIFSAAQKREFEAFTRESKEFQYLFTDREKGRPKHSSKSPAPQQQQPDDQQQRVPLARGDKAQQQQQQAPSRQRQEPEPGRRKGGSPSGKGSAAAAAAAAGGSLGGGAGPSPPSAAAVEAPPPPDDPAPAAAAAAAAAAGDTQQQQQVAAVGGGKPAPAAAAAAAGSRGPSIKIVISSTAVGAAEQPAAAADGWQQQQQQASPGASPGGGGVGLSGSKRAAVEIRDLDASDDLGDEQQQQQQQGLAGGVEQQAAKRARLEEQQQAGSRGPGDQQQQQQQQDVPPWESDEHRMAVDNGTPLQVVMSRLLESRRLVLVLDLDHTLVNSVKFSEVDPEWEYRLEQTVAEQLSRPRESQDLHRLVRMGMWTKLRPGVREFLARASQLFELWIYTAGSKPYAEAMASLLDPSGRYFGGRVIAQGVPDAPGGDEQQQQQQQPVVHKRLLHGLEGCEPLVLIVDDSSAVWPNDRRNLFVVERYIYFPSSRRRLGLAGKSLMEVDRDECPRRGMLMTALRVFEVLHEAVYARLPRAPLSTQPQAAAGWDVRNVMAAEKQRVLEGVVLVFSRVIPLETNPRQHPLWLLAEQYGATCAEQCSQETTHVVAMTGGTEKAMWARQHNRYVVGPAWLECSCIVWQRAAEERFPPPQG